MTRQLTLILIFVEKKFCLTRKLKVFYLFILLLFFFFVQAVLGNDPLETCLI